MSSKTKSKKAASKTEATTTKAQRERRDPEATKVFAFRLTPAESETIHKAAGPRNASQFARAILVAAAKEDDAALTAALADARRLRE